MKPMGFFAAGIAAVVFLASPGFGQTNSAVCDGACAREFFESHPKVLGPSVAGGTVSRVPSDHTLAFMQDAPMSVGPEKDIYDVVRILEHLTAIIQTQDDQIQTLSRRLEALERWQYAHDNPGLAK